MGFYACNGLFIDVDVEYGNGGNDGFPFAMSDNQKAGRKYR